MNEYNSSDDDGFLEPSLSIDAKALHNFSSSDIPTNGHEYLYSVISEAKKCPKTVVANFNKDKLTNHQNIYSPIDCLPKVPAEYLPSEEWKSDQIKNFSNIRLTVSKIKESLSTLVQRERSSCDWWDYIYNNEGKVIRSPLVSAVCCLDQVTVVTLLKLHSSWLQNKRLSFGADGASWLYSLLVCLEIPLDPDTCDCLRSLARYFWNTRAHIVTNTEGNDCLLQSTNLLICLIGQFFGQSDLAD